MVFVKGQTAWNEGIPQTDWHKGRVKRAKAAKRNLSKVSMPAPLPSLREMEIDWEGSIQETQAAYALVLQKFKNMEETDMIGSKGSRVVNMLFKLAGIVQPYLVVNATNKKSLPADKVLKFLKLNDTSITTEQLDNARDQFLAEQEEE